MILSPMGDPATNNSVSESMLAEVEHSGNVALDREKSMLPGPSQSIGSESPAESQPPGPGPTRRGEISSSRSFPPNISPASDPSINNFFNSGYCLFSFTVQYYNRCKLLKLKYIVLLLCLYCFRSIEIKVPPSDP